MKKRVRNETAKLKAQGRWGSTKDFTWSTKERKHMCCNSVHAFYHRAGCQFVNGNYDVSQLPNMDAIKDPEIIERIKVLKHEGKTSGEIARIVDIDLVKVNEVYIKVDMAII